MLKAIIVEDELNNQELLKSLLEDYCEGVEVITTARGVADAVKKIQAEEPDLLLLDIELLDGDGFQVLEQTENAGYEVIFTTAYDQYAVKAFKFSAADYLLKPIDPEELKSAVQRVQERKKQEQNNPSQAQLQALIQNIRLAQQPFKRIVLPTSNGFTVVDPVDIIRCESDRNYTFIFLKDGRKILVSRTIKEYEEMLEPYNFFRIHQSHLINLAYLKNYTRGRGGYVELSDGSKLDVAARKKTDFLKRLSAEE